MTTLAQEIRTFLQSEPFTKDDLQALTSVLEDQVLLACLVSPDVSLNVKVAVLEKAEIPHPIIDDLFFFAQLMHNHSVDFASVKPYIEGLMQEKNSEAFIEIYTREILDSSIIKKIEQLLLAGPLAEFSYCNFHFVLDPDIVGGFRICHRDTVWDYTVEGQLTAFHQQFISL